jgi:hypothetical protein
VDSNPKYSAAEMQMIRSLVGYLVWIALNSLAIAAMCSVVVGFPGIVDHCVGLVTNLKTRFPRFHTK